MVKLRSEQMRSEEIRSEHGGRSTEIHGCYRRLLLINSGVGVNWYTDVNWSTTTTQQKTFKICDHYCTALLPIIAGYWSTSEFRHPSEVRHLP